MEINKIFHPMLGKYIYQPNQQVDIQEILKELYNYRELNKECQEKTGMTLFQLLKGENKTEIIDGEYTDV